MADLVDNEQLKKSKQILKQQTRVAEDVSTMQDLTEEQKQFYSVETTKQENQLIDNIFQNQTALSSLKESDRIRLENVKERNMSHLLVNDKRFGGDSSYMEAVKQAVTNLEKKLVVKSTDDATLDQVEEAYTRVESACKDYMDNKHPWFGPGKRRLRKVRERYAKIQEELKLFRVGRSALKNGVPFASASTPMEVTMLGRKRDIKMNKDMPEFLKYYEKVNPGEIKEEDVERIQINIKDNALHDEIEIQRNRNQEAMDNDLDHNYNEIKDKGKYFYIKNLQGILEANKKVQDGTNKIPANERLLRDLASRIETLYRQMDLNEFLAEALQKENVSINAKFDLGYADKYRNWAASIQRDLTEYEALLQGVSKGQWYDPEQIVVEVNQTLFNEYSKRIQNS